MKHSTGTKRSITDDDRRLLVFRAAELSARSENSAVASSFLTPSEQRTVFEAECARNGADRLFFWGGYVGAERRKAVFLPAWLDVPKMPRAVFSAEREELFIKCLSEYGYEEVLWEFISVMELRESGFSNLSHRDRLGALMALGLKRNVLGDIAGDKDRLLLFADKGCCEYISTHLQRVGRDRVICTPCEGDISFSPERSFKELSFTVASPRADGVIRTLCGISREDAVQLILSGSAELNYYPLTDTSAKLSAGDILSLRGYGKFIIDRAQDETAKGRIRVLARKYI